MNSNRCKNCFQDRNVWISLSDNDFLKFCRIENYQASGKGGQKRNRKFSAVRLTHIPTEISVTSANFREQNINKLKAIEKLKIKIAIMLSGPSINIVRNIVSMKSQDYPLWIAFLIDELYANEFEIMPVAKKMNISNSKLLKLISRDRIVWDELNLNRIRIGKCRFIIPG